MKILKWLARKKLKSPINVVEGDTITVNAHGKDLVHADFKKSMRVDEVGVFEGKVGNKDAVGGVFIGKKHD